MSKSNNSGTQQAAQTDANTQSSAFNQIINLISGMQGTVSPLQSAAMPQLMSLISNPTPQQGVAPGLQAFYGSEMAGNNPQFNQFSQNAQSQLQQQFAQSLSTIMGNTGPGQNPNAQIDQLQDNLLSQSTNLAGNLAGQGQALANTGAQGLATTAQNTQNSQLQQLAPILSLLQSVFQTSTGALGGIGQSAGQGALGFSQLANTESQNNNSLWGSIFSGLLGGGGAAMTGGAAAPGGIGAILGGISDERLKRDITPIGEPVDGLQAVAFTWKHSGERDIGLVAQDVQKTHPELVGVLPGGTLFIDYGKAMKPFAARLGRILAESA